LTAVSYREGDHFERFVDEGRCSRTKQRAIWTRLP